MMKMNRWKFVVYLRQQAEILNDLADDIENEEDHNSIAILHLDLADAFAYENGYLEIEN